ncbi:MAG TPA: thiol reductant ABC exporter subunit CydC [Lentisphaeria bacterium]|nr:MAG: thiol reductant ABC exporter subunit CydC [Lentisphaerae bacterium GWF2_38_69]HBM15150.1 thiol reductant ABC exporter subunit CydC [Lentisphaeria bacterium]
MIIKIIKIILPYWKWMLLGLFLMLLTIGSSVGLMTVGAILITIAASQPFIATLQLPIVGVRFFGTSRGFFRYFEKLVTHNAVFKLLKEFRCYFYRTTEPFAPSILYKYSSADLLRRLVVDIESLDNIYSRFILPVTALLATVIILCFFLFFNFKLVLTLILALALTGLIVPYIAYLISRKYAYKLSVIQKIMAIENLDLIRGFNDIEMFSQEKQYTDKLFGLSRELIKFKSLIITINSSAEALMNLMFSLELAMVIYFMITDSYSIITVASAVVGTMALYEVIQASGLAFQKLSSTIESASRVFEVTEGKSHFPDLQIHNSPYPNSSEIIFDNVTFRYSGTESFQLLNINLKIAENECVLIIGPSGSGKSTIGSLLMDFYQPSSGKITLGEVNTSDIGQYKLTEYISLCEQRSHIFNDTVYENLKISADDISEDQLQKALTLSMCDNFLSVQNLKKINCANLSEGQKKRIAIARTILADKEIMIFDEPFANLDEKTAFSLSQNLLNMKKNKSIVIITHVFPKSYENADRIFLINQGKIEAEGTPADLEANKNGFYLKLRNYFRDY